MCKNIVKAKAASLVQPPIVLSRRHHTMSTSIETTAPNSAERGFHGFSAKESRGLDFDLNEPMINKTPQASLPCIDINFVPISQVSIYLFIKKMCPFAFHNKYTLYICCILQKHVSFDQVCFSIFPFFLLIFVKIDFQVK